MNNLKLALILVLLGSFLSNGISQEFVYKKKMQKHVFKPKKGKANSDLAYDDVKYLDAKKWLVSNDGLWGVFSKEGKLVIPVSFEKIDHYRDSSNLVKMEGVWGIYTDNHFEPHKGQIVFHNPDQITHLKECEGNSTNKEYDACLIQKMYYNLGYPKKAIEMKVEGMLVAELIIDKDGSIVSKKILRGLEGGLTEEFERFIDEDLTEWVPAKNDGEPVVSRKIVTARMKLKG